MSQTVKLVDGDGLELQVSGQKLVVVVSGANENLYMQRILVTATPQQIITGLSSRKKLRLKNASDADMFIGTSAAMTTGDSYPLFAQSYEDFDLGPGIQPYIMQVSGTGDCKIMETA